MQSATFEISVEELDQRFIEALKALFIGKQIKITVTVGSAKSKTPTLTLAKIIATNKQAATVHQISGDALNILLEKVVSDERFDLAETLEPYRVARP